MIGSMMREQTRIITEQGYKNVGARCTVPFYCKRGESMNINWYPRTHEEGKTAN